MTEENNSTPACEVDYGIGRIYVKGDENTSFEEVVEEFNTQSEDMVDTIEQLKEFDYELREKYDSDGGMGGGPSFS